MALGYLRDTRFGEALCDKEGWLKTGDFGEIDENGITERMEVSPLLSKYS